MSMTKKDYEMIASSFEIYLGKADIFLLNASERQMMTLLANNLASKLAKGNPLFDTDRFLESCGVTA